MGKVPGEDFFSFLAGIASVFMGGGSKDEDSKRDDSDDYEYDDNGNVTGRKPSNKHGGHGNFGGYHGGSR